MYELLLIATIVINLTADFSDRRSTAVSDPFSLTLWMGIVQSLLIFPVIGLVGSISLFQLALCALVAFIASFGRMRWYSALADHKEQLSRLAPFLRLSSVFVLLMAVFILGERLSRGKALGAGLVLLSALLTTMDRPAATLQAFMANNQGSRLVLIFAVSTACTSILYRYLLTQGVAIWTCYFYMRVFQLIAMLAIGLQKGSIVRSFRNVTHLRTFVFNRSLQTGAAFLYLEVVKHIPLTRAEPISALSPFIAIFGERLFGLQPSSTTPAAPRSSRARTLRFASLVIVAAGVVVLGVSQ